MLFRSTFYNPAYFAGGKVPATLISKNLMLACKWGIKTIYYSLINKVGAKAILQEEQTNVVYFQQKEQETEEEYCESCVL